MNFPKLLTTLLLMLTSVTSVNSTPKLVCSITGVVTDQQTGKPISVLVALYNDADQLIGQSNSNSVTGRYMITGLKPNRQYTIRIKSTTHIREEYLIIVPDVNEYMEFEKNFQLLKRGAL